MKTYITISLLFIVITLSGIQVSGSQSGTWTTDNNPYQIIGDVTIPSGSSLTINPGVQIQAMGNWQIIAQGNIIANATPTDSIRFVSGMIDQTTLWKGIRLENTSVQSQFSYCRVELGQYGINSINSPASITYCYFNKNQKGIQAYGIGAAIPAAVLIDHNKIEYSQHNGILIPQNSNATVTYNEITNNGLTTQYYGAIQLSNQSAGGQNNPTIAYNHIHHNRKQGIIAWDVANAGAINPNVHHNLIEYNLSGIYFRQASGNIYQNTVQNNLIAGNMNSGAGIMISGALANPCIAENIITGNYTAFYLTENANPIIGNPAINLPWAYGDNDIHDNIDANNVRHSIVLYQYTDANIQVYAQNNLWDYDTAAEIAVTITDHNDDGTLGTVMFDPWQNHIAPATITGVVTTILNPANVLNPKVQLISYDTGEILDEYPVILEQEFTFTTNVDTLVYIYVTATTADTSTPLYGAYRFYMLPFVQAVNLNPGEQCIVDTLSLYYPDMPWYNRRVGEPDQIDGHTAYPIYTGFLMYAPDSADWVYQDGEYLRIIRKQFHLNTDNPITIPVNHLIWYKQPPYEHGQTWQQVWQIDPDGTIVMADAHVHADIWDTTNPDHLRFFDLIEYLDSEGNGLGSDRTFTGGSYRRYGYENNSLIGWIDEETGSANDSLMYALIPGNRWFTEPFPYPESYNHVFDLFHTRGDSLTFYWQPPSADGHVYDHFRFKIDDTVYYDISYSQRHITIPMPIDGAPHGYRVCAIENGNEFAISPYLWFAILPVDDEVMPQVSFEVFPNPFRPGDVGSITIQSKGKVSDKAKVSIYNLKGQKVNSLQINKESKAFYWDGKDTFGQPCASGLYQIRLTNISGRKICKKVMLIH